MKCIHIWKKWTIHLKKRKMRHKQGDYIALPPFPSSPVPLVWKLFALPSVSCYGFETHFIPALLAPREPVVIQVFLFPFPSSILVAYATFSLQALERSYLRVLQADVFPWLRSPTLYQTPGLQWLHICMATKLAVSNSEVFPRSHSLRQPRIPYKTQSQKRSQYA